MTRVAPGTRMTTSAITTLFMDAPKAAISPKARIIGGNPIKASTSLCTTISEIPPV